MADPVDDVIATLVHPSSGVSRIAVERLRQISEENWTAAHDDAHDGGEMAMAAACYAAPLVDVGLTEGHEKEIAKLPEVVWPWDQSWWKPSKVQNIDGRIRELDKAGALIAAEIDRLLRLKERGNG